MNNIVIRKAERQDVPLLLEFIKGIARYEKMENEVIASEFNRTKFFEPSNTLMCNFTAFVADASEFNPNRGSDE